ncbi:hypothetical protein CN176_03595 [Sinorhizobium medicae]|uniref:trypsin-like serine peptidase n=1 Tax=Sinorhizobium medicae TaxID=110321 RepID=UPI000FD8FCCC|nr:hypothetical protein [Sinorhizobium medicae]RVJ45876.1 hypothetical protein CN176_03595 [Sinorhizobium medicae]
MPSLLKATFWSVLAAMIIATAGHRGSDSALSAGPFHPHCFASFWRLPIDQYGYPIDTDADGTRSPATKMLQHLAASKSKYLAYDRDCFKPYRDLKEHTRQFIGPSLGAVFTDDPRFFCSAFRLAADTIMTAGHCANGIEGADRKMLRLVGYPDLEIEVLEQIPPPVQEPVEDLADFALFRIQDPGIAGFWTKKNFSRDTARHQVILIIAVSLIPRELQMHNTKYTWLDDVRFSRAFSSKTWPPDGVQTNLPVSSDRSECIYHRAPTFPGMSGAPIIAVHAPAKPAGLPTFSVIGIHLRNGAERDADCGQAFDYNVGIKIPLSILNALE